MRILHILSATAAAGKTVWGVGMARALRNAGFRVAVFKAVSEDEVGYEVPYGRVSLAALHLMAAAGVHRSGKVNPVLMRPISANRAEVWLLGEHVGVVPRLGRDTCLLCDLSPVAQQMIMTITYDCLEEVAGDADIVISEGSGGATDLTLLGAWDLANFVIPSLATAGILVARTSTGGALASLAGTVSLIHPDVRTRLQGLALNDVRHKIEDTVAAGKLVAANYGLTFLGATPWISYFEGRPQYEPFTQESNEDHQTLALAIQDSIDLPKILQWLHLSRP